MEIYHLFRGDELVCTSDPGSIGAGNLHNRGQSGDVLICDNKKCLVGWYWYPQGQNDNHQHLAWERIPDGSLDPKYKVLILLQK